MMVTMNPPQEQPSTSSNPATTPNPENLDDFLSSCRTGRRNALPDILSDHSSVTSSELPTKLENLSTKDAESAANNPSTSKKSDNV